MIAKFRTFVDKNHFPDLQSPFKNEEAAAKLLCPEKSMTLSHVTSDSEAATIHSTRPTPSGLAEENGRNVAQKGDFNGQMSFAQLPLEGQYL